MYVCLCKAVTTRQIEEAIENGVASFGALRSKLGVASGCGQCASEVHQMLELSLGDRDARGAVAVRRGSGDAMLAGVAI